MNNMTKFLLNLPEKVFTNFHDGRQCDSLIKETMARCFNFVTEIYVEKYVTNIKRKLKYRAEIKVCFISIIKDKDK